MMQCYLCKDENGPFEIEEYKKRCVLMCEKCAKKIRREKEKNKKSKEYYYRVF